MRSSPGSTTYVSTTSISFAKQTAPSVKTIIATRGIEQRRSMAAKNGREPSVMTVNLSTCVLDHQRPIQVFLVLVTGVTKCRVTSA